MNRVTHLLLCTLLFVSLACSSSSSSSTLPGALVVTDTLGKAFTASCSSSLCSLTANDPNVVANSCSVGYGTDAFVLLWSRVLTVHAMNVVSGSAVEFSSAEPAHPVACTTDAECTPWNATVGTTTYQYACLNGICQDASLSLGINDVIALCQADIPWPASCPYITSQPFASRLSEVGAVCSNSKTCSTVPGDCKQPTAATAGLDAGAAGLDAGMGGLDAGKVSIDGTTMTGGEVATTVPDASVDSD